MAAAVWSKGIGGTRWTEINGHKVVALRGMALWIVERLGSDGLPVIGEDPVAVCETEAEALEEARR